MDIFNTTWTPPGSHEGILPGKVESFVVRSPGLLLATIVFYLFCKYTKRVYFHPLSGIPGPRLAAATHLYEAYHNIIGGGLSKKYNAMHKKYSQ